MELVTKFLGTVALIDAVTIKIDLILHFQLFVPAPGGEEACHLVPML
jgi:hypothetical protein